MLNVNFFFWTWNDYYFIIEALIYCKSFTFINCIWVWGEVSIAGTVNVHFVLWTGLSASWLFHGQTSWAIDFQHNQYFQTSFLKSFQSSPQTHQQIILKRNKNINFLFNCFLLHLMLYASYRICFTFLINIYNYAHDSSICIEFVVSFHWVCSLFPISLLFLRNKKDRNKMWPYDWLKYHGKHNKQRFLFYFELRKRKMF